MFRNIAIIGHFLLLLLGINAEAIQGKNYVKNPDFESGNTGYKYSGTSQGLDRTELGNLDRNGKQSITLTGGSGAFLESDPIKMDKILAGKACSTSIKYLLNSGGGFFTVYSGATTGSMSEITSSRFNLSIQPTAKTAYIASFPCPEEGHFVKWRVEFNASGSSVNLDNSELGLASFNEVPNVTSWKDHGPITIQAVTSNPSKGGTIALDKNRSRQVGENYEVELMYRQTTAGSNGSGDYLFVLPNGIQFDSSVEKYTGALTHAGGLFGISASGSANIADTTSSANSLYIVPYDNTRYRVLTYFVGGASNMSYVSSSGFNLGNAIISYGFNFKFKGAGLTNSSTVINAECPDQYACVDTFTQFVTASGVRGNANVPNWITSVSITDTSLFALTFKSGLFTVEPTCVATPYRGSNDSYAMHTQIEFAMNTTKVDVRTKDTAANKVAFDFIISCTRSGSDFKGKRVLQAQLGEEIYVKAHLTANQGVSAGTVILYNMIDESSHGSTHYNTSNGQITLPVGRTYLLSGQMQCGDGNSFVLYKNGVAYQYLAGSSANYAIQSGGFSVIIKQDGNHVWTIRSAGGATCQGGTLAAVRTNYFNLISIGN